MNMQLKRTNVGIALVSNPRVLFLDEPTSGTTDCHHNPMVNMQCRFRTAAVTELLRLVDKVSSDLS